MNMRLSTLAAIAILALFLLMGSVYTVSEGYRGIVLRLGKIIDDNKGIAEVKSPGLHFKWPFINSVQLFDVRLQTLAIEASRIVTAEKKDVIVDYFVKWRINDIPLYYTRTSGNRLQAETLLEQKLNDGLRAEFGKRDIQDVVAGERVEIMSLLRETANNSAKSLGIKVVDVRIKSIDLPDAVRGAVFDRMRAERERIATEHRALGRSKAEVIRAQADANVTVVLATAQGESYKIRGEGDAKAAEAYANAYKKAPDFFAFLRSTDAYQKSLNDKRDMLVLQPDSQFFKYFNRANGVSEKKKAA